MVAAYDASAHAAGADDGAGAGLLRRTVSIPPGVQILGQPGRSPHDRSALASPEFRSRRSPVPGPAVPAPAVPAEAARRAIPARLGLRGTRHGAWKIAPRLRFHPVRSRVRHYA